MSLKNTQVSTKSQDCSKRLQMIFGFLEAKPDLKKMPDDVCVWNNSY